VEFVDREGKEVDALGRDLHRDVPHGLVGMEGMTRWVVKQMVGNVVLQRGRLDKPNSFYQSTSVR
jgi:hypothetical protein